MKRIIITSKFVALFLLLNASPVIAQNSRFNQNQIDWLAKELGVSSADLAKKINKAKDDRIKVNGTYWSLLFLENECKKNADKINGVNVSPRIVDIRTLTVINRIDDNGEDVCSKIEDNSFRSFCLNSFDKNKDGRVSLMEASEVKTIKVPGKGIHSLAGIENFENLTSLDCNDNHLTQLDVSKNTKLKMLSCNENQLTQLDVSKNTSLEDFGCSHNQLSFLDVSKNAALQQLFCEHNQLSKLNVSGCSALKKLACDNNQLTSLDISGATALEELVCNDNQLSNLDISRNSVLWSLICQNNQFANLDTSRNPKLSYFVLERNSNQRESTKVTEAVWVSDTGSTKFKLYTDGTADVFVLGVGRSSTWKKESGMIYVRGFGNIQAYVINQNGELYALESDGRLTRVKNSSSSPFATITGSDGVIMHKQ